MEMFEPRRLHPVAAFLSFLKQLRELLIPFVLFLFIGGRGDDTFFQKIYFLGIGGIIIFLFITGILSWYRFTYRVENRELRIEYGIFVRKKRYIPQERIQTIDVSAGVIQRLFHLVKVQVETAGGGNDADAILTAITASEAEELKSVLLNPSTDNENVDDAGGKKEEIYFKLARKDLLVAASTSGGIGVVLSAALAFLVQFDELIPYEALFKEFEKVVRFGFVFFMLVAVIVLLASWLIAIAGTVLKYANFTVIKKGDELMISRGLLEKRHLTIPLQRIQAIRISENLIRQPLGLATVYVESAGSSSGKEDDFSTMLFPVVKKSSIESLIGMFAPEYQCEQEIHRVPFRALHRYLIRSIIPVIPLVVVAVIFLRPWGYFSLLLIITSVIIGYIQYRDAGWAISDNQLLLRFRKINKVTILVQKKRIQALERNYSFFQKRKGLCNIQASIKASMTGKHFRVVDVDKESCLRIEQWFAKQREASN